MEFLKGIKPLKGPEDWPLWRDRILDVLAVFNAVDIVEGKSIEPILPNENPTKADREAVESWRKSAAQAKVVLSQSVSDELHQRISG